MIAHRIPLAPGRLQGGRSRAISQRQTQQDRQPADGVGQVLDQLPVSPSVQRRSSSTITSAVGLTRPRSWSDEPRFAAGARRSLQPARRRAGRIRPRHQEAITLNAMPDGQLALAPLDENVGSRPGLAGRPCDPRVRRLPVPVLAAGVPRDRAGRPAARRERAVRVPAFPADRYSPARARRGGRGRSRRPAGPVLGLHELLFRRRKALEDGDLRGYAVQLGLDVAAFDHDKAGPAVLARIRRDLDSGRASARCWRGPLCSWTASCTAAATIRPPCWPLST